MLEEADIEMTQMAMQEGGASSEDTKGLFAQFYTRAHPDETASKEAGRPKFTDKAYIRILMAGNKENQIDRPASEIDKARFPKQWSAYESKSTEEFVEGTPLNMWPILSPAQIEELRFANVRTVEQLANMPDAQAQGAMGFAGLKLEAQAFLEASGKSAEGMALSDELKTLRVENKSLADTVAVLTDRISKLEGPTKPSKKATSKKSED